MQDETDLGESVLAGVAKDSRDARGTTRGPGLPSARYRHVATYTDLAPRWVEDTSPPGGRSIYGSIRQSHMFQGRQELRDSVGPSPRQVNDFYYKLYWLFDYDAHLHTKHRVTEITPIITPDMA